MMSDELFIASEDGGENWLIAWTGCDTALRHWNVTTNRIHGSELYKFTRGPEEDARLIAKLLNWYYADPKKADTILEKELEPA